VVGVGVPDALRSGVRVAGWMERVGPAWARLRRSAGSWHRGFSCLRFWLTDVGGGCQVSEVRGGPAGAVTGGTEG